MAEPSSKADRAWATAAWGALVAVLLVGGLLGFVIVPAIQAKSLGIDPWTAICRAAGLRPAALVYVSGAKTHGALPVSEVTWDPNILGALAHADRRDGAQLAASACSACHGEAGVSENPQFPFLADQSAAAIYKQLHDYRSGARASPIMSPLVQQLSERQMLDLAAYFSHDEAVGALGRRWPDPDRLAERLAFNGDPARNLPSCAACHGAGVGGPIETPTLIGQHEEYILRQLQLYASGERRNDVYGRMRSVARRLTPDEMARLATYYQGLR
ncbi:MAG: c-type cytochrome [Pseudomonadota bacterium]